MSETFSISTNSLFGKRWPAVLAKMPLTELRKKDAREFRVRVTELQEHNAEALTIKLSGPVTETILERIPIHVKKTRTPMQLRELAENGATRLSVKFSRLVAPPLPAQ